MHSHLGKSLVYYRFPDVRINTTLTEKGNTRKCQGYTSSPIDVAMAYEGYCRGTQGYMHIHSYFISCVRGV